jgi:hypothetical protein
MKSIWNWIKKAWEWLKSSHRLLHFLIGTLVGFGANSWYCAEYVGIVVAGAMEFKDWQWGGKPDWLDALLTDAGVNVGYLVRWLIFG